MNNENTSDNTQAKALNKTDVSGCSGLLKIIISCKNKGKD